MSLELNAIWWLKFDKRCPLVITERCPRAGYCGQPDVLGITDARYMLEIEIKRSVSDFRANFNKPHMRNRLCNVPEVSNKYIQKAPRQFWFFVPEKIADKVAPLVPEWSGLLVQDSANESASGVRCVKKAAVNQASEKLSLKDCARLLRNVGNTIFGLYQARANMISAGYHMDPHGMDDFYSKKLEWDGESHVYVPNYEYLNFQI